MDLSNSTKVVIAWDKDDMATLNRVIGNMEEKISRLKKLRLLCHTQSPDPQKKVLTLEEAMKGLMFS